MIIRSLGRCSLFSVFLCVGGGLSVTTCYSYDQSFSLLLGVPGYIGVILLTCVWVTSMCLEVCLTDRSMQQRIMYHSNCIIRVNVSGLHTHCFSEPPLPPPGSDALPPQFDLTTLSPCCLICWNCSSAGRQRIYCCTRQDLGLKIHLSNHPKS